MIDAELDAPTPAEPLAVQDCHALLKWMLPVIDRMPRSRRYGLGSRIENGLIEVLARLVAASYSRDKRNELEVANRELAIVRHLWRLCRELELINVDRHAHGARLMVELGRQIGG
ncbi:MAG: diversity-generating retroelement protein Avd [Xanthomonadales bacterium]|jgi:hypothetical protein|nr:diversity-generating retroelement protein Avd [Xanthomonadales bacterium]